jgi:curli production assembly/transport component CsgG/holdfast attachment protein HfaB
MLAHWMNMVNAHKTKLGSKPLKMRFIGLNLLSLFFVPCLILGLSGCASLDHETGLYAKPVKGAPATTNPSLYTSALHCQALKAQSEGRQGPRVAVGRIADLTGKYDLETGAKIGEGATLYALTALGRSGFRVVERTDTTVSDLEIAYAKAQLIGDDQDIRRANGDNYRKLFAGQIAGSDYYIVGGITELNANIASSGADLSGGDAKLTGLKGSFQGRRFILNVAVDLRLVDTRSQEVVDMASYQKQLLGYEVKAGIFDFLNGNVFDLSGGLSKMEPLHMGVRSLVERSVLQFSETLYGINSEPCLLYAAKNPLKPVPAYAARDINHGSLRTHNDPLSANRTQAALDQDGVNRLRGIFERENQSMKSYRAPVTGPVSVHHVQDQQAQPNQGDDVAHQAPLPIQQSNASGRFRVIPIDPKYTKNPIDVSK